MGRIEHSMAARVPKKKRASSVATFPNLTLLGVIAKPVHQSSSFHRWEWVFSLLFLFGGGCTNQGGAFLESRKQVAFVLLYYGVGFFWVMLIGFWFCGFWRECVCV
jgi:hypothetical protein